MTQNVHSSNAPSETALLERSISLCNQSIFTIALQHRRLQTSEPEDEIFIFRKWADFQFMIVALQRLRRSAKIAANVASVSAHINEAIKTFDSMLPGLSTMRNVAEHIDEYALDKGHNPKISRTQLQVSTQDGNTINWLEHTFNIDEALKTAEALFVAVQKSADILHNK